MSLDCPLNTFDPYGGIMKYAAAVRWPGVSTNKSIDSQAVLEGVVGPNALNHCDPGLLVTGDFNVDDDFAALISNPYPVAFLYVKMSHVCNTQLNSRARFFFNRGRGLGERGIEVVVGGCGH